MDTARSPTTRGASEGSSSRFGSFHPHQQSSNGQDALGINRVYSTSPNAGRRPDPFNRNQNPAADWEAVADGADATPSASALLLRKLSASMTQETLNSMLLFASDLIDTQFVHSAPASEDNGYQMAVARFSSIEGASEVRQRLHGKPNASGDASMVVEIIKGPNLANQQRRVSDAQAAHLSTSASSGGSSHGRPSRFSNQFQTIEQRTSPTRASRVPGSLDFTNMDGAANSKIEALFSPTSPIRTTSNRARLPSRSIIGDETTDDETRELLSNPVAFAEGSHRNRNTARAPIAQFGNLRLDTNDENEYDGPGGHHMMSPSSGNGMFSARSGQRGMQTPNTDYSSSYGFSPTSPHNSFSPSARAHQFPPANPADQNPPCNTLYVGNLPLDTSEDELKAIFSKQRGYRRLCFRTKHNGPMCFVEFEGITEATRALKELYGHMLHNSVKGGIRLSFSKNPLGVRKDQMSMHSPMAAMGSPYGNFGGPGFATANGPPPGLSMPPGMNGQMPQPNGARADQYYGAAGGPSGQGNAGPGSEAFMAQGIGHPYMTSMRGFPPIDGFYPADGSYRR